MKRHLKKWRASVYYNQNGTFRSMQATCAPIESWLCFRISGIKAESGGTQKKRIRALVLKSIAKKGGMCMLTKRALDYGLRLQAYYPLYELESPLGKRHIRVIRSRWYAMKKERH